MNKFFYLLTVNCYLLTFLVACGPATPHKSASQGAPYEMVVVADHPVWDGAAGDSLRSIFYRRFPMINRDETRMDLLRILPRDLKNLTQKHPNILIARVDPTVDAMLSMNENVWAAPQMVITASAPTADELAALIGGHSADIMDVIEGAERMRDVSRSAGRTPEPVAAAIRDKFGFEMSTYPGYTVRDGSRGDFLWLSYEMPTASQGIVVYSYPFESSDDLSPARLLARRNEFAGLIPGEVAGSFMTTNPEFSELTFKEINGRSWAEVRGFWSVEGDFMGGPFVNFSTVDVVGGRVISIDFYVYSPDPRAKQRNYIRQLEHLIYTVKM